MPADRPAGTVLAGIDRAAFAVALATRLRGAGVPVSVTAVRSLVLALAEIPPDTVSGLYWTARITLLGRQPEVAAFDEVFATVFGDRPGAARPAAGHARGQGGPAAGDVLVPVPRTAPPPDTDDGGGLPWVTLPPAVAPAEAGDDGNRLVLPERLPSALDGLADVPFAELDPAEMEQLARWLRVAAPGWPVRRTRRTVTGRSGRRIAVRPTVAGARRTGGEVLTLVRERPADRPRRVVMLCDVSQSMQAQACAYLHLMRAVTVLATAEVFAFGTTLTRLTPVLAHRSAAVAVERATAAVTDRFGGTRIATNVAGLLASRHGDSVRGAIVVIGSDGWDSDPPERLGIAMARLRRRAFRVIWMNPRAAAPGFAPEVAAMAAAVPHCDRLLPAHTFRSLAGVIEAITAVA